MLYSGKSGCILVNWLYLDKMVLFGQKWMYSRKSGCIRAKWLYSEKVLYSGKEVVLGQK